MDVLKILVVGPQKTGKTNLILSLLNEDLRLSEQNSSFQGLQGPVQNHQRDFVLKILRLNGKKIRVQLWDVTGGSSPETAFAPLFIRNSVGCIIVTNPTSPRMLQDVLSWKQAFDKYTQVPSCPAFPSALFINHMAFGEIAEPLEISKQLEESCREIQDKCGFIGIYHVNSMTKEDVENSFADYIEKILYDQDANQRTMSMIDELWDESIKIKKRNLIAQTEQRDHNIQLNNDPKNQANRPTGRTPNSGMEQSPRQEQLYQKPTAKQSISLDPNMHKQTKSKKKKCCKS